MPDDWYEEGSVEDKVEWAEEWGPTNDGVNINWLAEDVEADVREALARNKNTPIAILERLAEDEKHMVKVAVLTNPSSPKNIVDKLEKYYQDWKKNYEKN